MPVRLATICGLVAPLKYTAALVFGGLAQPDAFSSADNAISDLGSDTASSGWIYNQIGLNLTGILVVVFALGLWRELSPDLLGRLGAVECRRNQPAAVVPRGVRLAPARRSGPAVTPLELVRPGRAAAWLACLSRDW